MKLFNSRSKRLLALTFAFSFVAGSLGLAFVSNFRRAPARPDSRAASPAPGQALENYGRIPLSFEANRGQADDSVDFLARGAGYSLFLRPAEATFVLSGPRTDAAGKRRVANASEASKVLRMKLVGADPAASAEGADEFAGKANYLVGDDPSKWRTGVPTFGRVHYASVYPGIDLVYYGNQRQLEYDFRIAPGADPRAVSLEFEGADGVKVDEAGDLLLALGESVVRQPKPFVYQEVAGARRAVEGGYAVASDGRVRFALGEYDAALPLVIDPVIVYSSYLGGTHVELSQAIAVDSAGSAYLTGFTASTNFPTANALQPANGGTDITQDAFVTKVNAAGTALVYSTYLGGSAQDQSRGIAVDSAGNAYVTGLTLSPNFPATNAIQPAFSGIQDAFVAKLNAAGSAFVYSTFLGGTGPENVESVAVDSAGNAYLTGYTASADFLTTPGAPQGTKRQSDDAFVTKLNVTGTALVYSTFLGGDVYDSGRSIAVDCAGNAYVTGYTASLNFPVTQGAFQPSLGGGPPPSPSLATTDAFVTKLNAAGTAFVYSTYLGGNNRDMGEGLAIDSGGNAYVTGLTESINFPTASPIQPNNNASAGVMQEAFVTKVNASGSALVYSTYLGGGSGEIGQGIAVDSAGNAYVTGATGSTNFPTANAIQNARSGGSDAFVTKLNAAGNAFVYSTYLGGSNPRAEEQGVGIAVDAGGNAYVIGNTDSTNFPTVTPFQAALAVNDPTSIDAFVTKIADTNTAAASQFQFTQTAPAVQEDVTFVTLTVQRTGDATQAAAVDYATADGTASERRDYTTAVGTLRFAAGETSKTFDVLVNEDSFSEGNETFTVALSNATGGALLSCPTAVATVQITDDAVEPTTNVIDDATIFVDQHYHDFLNRESDAAGLAFWSGQIIACGADAACIDRTRASVSQAFFLSIEFQATGYYAFRHYKATFTDTPARPRGMPRYREFLRDSRELGRDVVVGQGPWQAQLDANRQEFSRQWVQRPDFVAQFPVTMTPAEFVDKLFQNTGATPTTAERDAAIAAYGAGDTEGRANALRAVIESGSVYNRQFNAAFVLSQYVGYLRRNPNDAPDSNYAGFDFWLAKLDSFSLPGEDVRNEQTAISRAQRAEMVRAFILSAEYRGRFGQP